MSRRLFVALLALILCLPVAQALRTGHSHASQGQSTRDELLGFLEPPKKLTLAQRSMLVDRPLVSTNEYLELSPTFPTGKNGHLELAWASVAVGARSASEHALVGMPLLDGARLVQSPTHLEAPDAQSPHVSLHFAPHPLSSRYLVDFRVGGGETYFIRTWPGGREQTFGAGQHVVVTLELPPGYADDVHVALTAKAAGQSTDW